MVRAPAELRVIMALTPEASVSAIHRLPFQCLCCKSRNRFESGMKTGASIHFLFFPSQKLLDFDYGDEEEEEEEEPVEETSTLAPPETNLEDSGGRPSEPNALALR